MVSKFPYLIIESSFTVPPGGQYDDFPDTGQKFDGLQRAARFAACEAFEVATKDTMVSLAEIDCFSTMFAELGWFDDTITISSPDIRDPDDVFFLGKLVSLCTTYGKKVEEAATTSYVFWMNIAEFVYPIHYYPDAAVGDKFKIMVQDGILQNMFIQNSDGSFSLNWGQGPDSDVALEEIPSYDKVLVGYNNSTLPIDNVLDTLQQGYEMAAAARVMAQAAYSYTSDRIADAKDFLLENLDIFRQTGREAVQEVLAYFDNLDFTSNSLSAALGVCQQYLQSFASARVSQDGSKIEFDGNTVITKPIFSLSWVRQAASTLLQWVGQAMLVIKPIAGISS